MNSINEKQNSASALKQIGAFRQAYTTAKLYGYLQLIINVLIPSLLAGAALILNSDGLSKTYVFEKVDIAHYLIASTILIFTIDYLIIRPTIDKYRTIGAQIQEAFDTSLYELDWNNVTAGDKPSPDTIHTLSRKFFKRNTDKYLINWYSINDLTPLHLAVLTCQYSCLSWDIELRKRIIQFVTVIGIFIVGTLITLAACYNFDTKTILLSVLSVATPLLSYAHNVYKENTQTIDQTTKLKKIVNDTIESVNPLTTAPALINKCRQIQDQIFTYRTAAWPIPNWVYWINRSSFESNMGYSAEDIQMRLLSQQNGQPED